MRPYAIVLFLCATVASAKPDQCQLSNRKCVPPAGIWIDPHVTSPYNTPVTYAGTTKMGGETYWLWRKAAEPTVPCTAVQRADKGQTGQVCRAAIGTVIFQGPPWMDK